MAPVATPVSWLQQLGSFIHPLTNLSLRGGVCLGPTTNNVAEYSAVIELLRDALSHGISYLEVRLDSQLIVFQLTGVYRIRDPGLLRQFLRVRLLERHFHSIRYEHIPRNLNNLADSLANYVLDWHLHHTLS